MFVFLSVCVDQIYQQCPACNLVRIIFGIEEVELSVVVELKSLAGLVYQSLDIFDRNGEFFCAGLIFEVLFIESAYAIFALCYPEFVREDLHLYISSKIELVQIFFFKLTDSFVVSCD